MYQPLYITR